MDWIWDEISENRFDKAMKLKPTRIDAEHGSGVFESEHGIYMCTLTHCNCPDFQYNMKAQQPCKHILSLGAELGAYDVEAVKEHFEAEKALALLADAYGHFYLLDQPIMSNRDYDALKEKWSAYLPKRNTIEDDRWLHRKG